MKEWAIEKGATHYTHWFQPLTGITSEKHDALPRPDGRRPRHHDAFPARSSSRASPMHPASPRAACAPPSRPAATPPGIRRATRSSRTRCCASPPRSAAIPARRSTRRRRFCAPWSPSTSRRTACSSCSASGHQQRRHHGRRRAGVLPHLREGLRASASTSC